MNKNWIIMIAVVLLALPVSALASDCCPSERKAKAEMDHSKMDHDMTGQDQHCPESMSMSGDMIMLGSVEQQGVKAMGHLKDVSAAMAELKMSTTHHLMVMFSDANSGKAIEKGSVAVKITTPAGEQHKAVKLIGMQGHFGADVSLDEAGTYLFTIGTRLEDGQKRLFSFNYTNQGN